MDHRAGYTITSRNSSQTICEVRIDRESGNRVWSVVHVEAFERASDK
jgi:hypothetical protein